MTTQKERGRTAPPKGEGGKRNYPTAARKGDHHFTFLYFTERQFYFISFNLI